MHIFYELWPRDVSDKPEDFLFSESRHEEQMLRKVEGKYGSCPVFAKELTVISRSIQYNTIQYNTIQYNTIQYNTIQYNTIQFYLNTVKNLQFTNGKYRYTMINGPYRQSNQSECAGNSTKALMLLTRCL